MNIVSFSLFVNRVDGPGVTDLVLSKKILSLVILLEFVHMLLCACGMCRVEDRLSGSS
jgi:hypothetical protein